MMTLTRAQFMTFVALTLSGTDRHAIEMKATTTSA
jgi:hypothetical protein